MASTRQEDCNHQVAQEYPFVAAIDFGTVYSGYAFSTITDQNKISMNKNWSGGSFESYKTPTSVLFGPTGFKEFGYEAEKEYSESGEEGLELYRRFKMMLHDQTIVKDLQITATNGTTRPALEVFAEALKFLKNHMVTAINTSLATNLEDNMIRWVITLPAIWRDEAKHFMREAAKQAKLIETFESKQLVLALEPEVASIYCRKVPVNLIPDQIKESMKFDVDSEYIVIDAGGGTVDITAHKVLEGGYVREILQPCGGPWGGIQIDSAFEKLLKDILGAEVMKGLKDDSELWLKLTLSFEIQKRCIDSNNTKTHIGIDMSYQLCKKLQKLTGMDIEQSLSRCKNPHVYFDNGRLIVDHDTSIKLFIPTVQQIVNYTLQLLQKPELSDISFILLVGGFGTCKILQTVLKDSLAEGIHLIVPEEAQLAIVKGAVQFGLDSKLVESRFARKTYGIGIEPRFRKSKHDKDKRVQREGIAYCRDVFLKFIDIGTPVYHDKITCRTVFPRTPKQQSMSFDIYCCDETDLNDVEYVSDKKFIHIGELMVKMPDYTGGLDREVEVQFHFGGTELSVTAKDITSGEVAATQVNMLP